MFDFIKYKALLRDPKTMDIWVVPLKYVEAVCCVYGWTCLDGGNNLLFCTPEHWKGYPPADKTKLKRALRVYKSLKKKKR